MPALAAQLGGDTHTPVVNRMLEAAKERGSQVEIAVAGQCVIGVANDDRLPDQAGLASEDGWAAAFVGSLDNPEDFTPAGATPAEQILRLVRHQGPQAITGLRGAFALLVTDGRSGWAARDHLGLETLYYSNYGDGLVLASEIGQLLEISDHRPDPDLGFLEALFFEESFDDARCAYVGVSRLPKRRWMEWSDGATSVNVYWSPEHLLEQSEVADEEVLDRFDHLMSQAVRRTLHGPTAVLLSGGIDSPAVAAYGAEAHLETVGIPLGAVTATYPAHSSVNELTYVQAVATELGLDLHPYRAAPLRLDRLTDWVRMFGTPWIYWHPGAAEESYLIAAENGYRNILTGMFAEFVVDHSRSLLAHYVWTGRWDQAAKLMSDRRAFGVDWQKNARELISALMPRAAHSVRRRLRPRFVVPAWIDRTRIAKAEAADVPSPRLAWRRAQLGMLHGAGVSMDADSMLQARAGVRVRHPWVDVDLWEFFLGLRAPAKFPELRSKALVRRLLRGRVPNIILDRTDKTVFNEYMTDQIDFSSLERWLVDPKDRLRGVDYGLLADHLARREMSVPDFLWAMQLATIHAFLDQW